MAGRLASSAQNVPCVGRAKVPGFLWPVSGLQVEDAQECPVVGGGGPAGIIDDETGLLIEKGPERAAGKDVVEAGVDVLVVPVVGPDRTTGVLVGEGLQIAGGLGGPLNGANRALPSGIVEIAVDAEQYLGVVLQNPVGVFAEEIGLVTAHEVLVPLRDFSLGLEVHA